MNYGKIDLCLRLKMLHFDFKIQPWQFYSFPFPAKLTQELQTFARQGPKSERGLCEAVNYIEVF